LARKRDPRGKGLLPGADGDEVCARGNLMYRGREMLHVWLIRHPTGPFGTQMFIPREIVNEELEKRDRAREERRQRG
jgi:hypothetical protein